MCIIYIYLLCWNYFRKHRIMFTFLAISQPWDGTDSLNPSSWKTRIFLSCIANTMAANGSWQRHGINLICQNYSGGCFTIVLRALQNILSKFVCGRNRTSHENFKLKLYVYPKPGFGHTYKVSAWNFTINMMSGIVYFRKIILENSQNISETTPRFQQQKGPYRWLSVRRQ